jgi:hypothetical protein
MQMTLKEIEAVALVGAVEIEIISQIIQPYLHGRERIIQAGVIADLLAKWLFGHKDLNDRARQRDDFLALVDGLVECLERDRPGNLQ